MVFGQIRFFGAVCPALPYRTAPSLGLSVLPSAPELSEVQTGLTHYGYPTWKMSLESPWLGDVELFILNVLEIPACQLPFGIP